MMWFKNAYDRALAADFVMSAGNSEQLAPGYERTRFAVQPLGRTAILMHHAERRFYDPKQQETVVEPEPFYQVHFEYANPDGTPITAMIDFTSDYANLKHSQEQAYVDRAMRAGARREDLPADWEIWDQAMAALDESLYANAKALGWMLMPHMVERIPQGAEQPQQYPQAA